MFTNIQSDLCHGEGWDWAALELHPCWEPVVTAVPESLGRKHPCALVWRVHGRWLTFAICIVNTSILSTCAKIRPRVFKRNLAFLRRDRGSDCKFQGGRSCHRFPYKTRDKATFCWGLCSSRPAAVTHVRKAPEAQWWHADPVPSDSCVSRRDQDEAAADRMDGGAAAAEHNGWHSGRGGSGTAASPRVWLCPTITRARPQMAVSPWRACTASRQSYPSSSLTMTALL